MRTLPVLALLLAAAALAPAQEPEAPRCRACDSTGLVPCPEHDADECALEGGLWYCSFLAGCATCAGTGRVDCERCENPAAEAELHARRQRATRSAPGMLALDETMGRALRKGESEHFQLVWEIDDMKVGRKRLDDHALLHLYLDRLEELYDVYIGTLGVKASEFSRKPLVLVWYLPKDQWEGSLRFCSSSNARGVKLMGVEPRYSVCGNKQNFRDDESLHRNVVHSVTHLLFSNQRPAYWIGQLQGGAWPDEGLAHWMEMYFFDRADTYCYQEQNTLADFKGGQYRVGVRKLVATGKEPRIAEVMSRVTNTLTPEEHAVAFSYVDYLIHLSGEKFSQLGRRMRGKVEGREALAEVYELNPLQLEERWKEWVLATYPAR